MAGGRILFLTGAPLSDLLDWREEGLTATLLGSFLDVGRDGTAQSSPRAGVTSLLGAKWRVVPHDISRNEGLNAPDHGRIIPDSVGMNAEAEKDADQDFFEHSMAVLDDIQTSQLAPQTQDASTVSEGESTFFDGSLADITMNGSALALSDPTTDSPIAAVAVARAPLFRGTFQRGTFTSIKAIPTPSQLLQLKPQTVTVTVIVGIISISEPRSVYIRRGDYAMDLIEIVVGDETKAGFTITAWLPQPSTPTKDSPLKTRARSARHTAVSDAIGGLRSQIINLRRGDVVFMAPLALTAFRDVVYGQTLSRRSSGIKTSITKIDRRSALPAPAQDKVDRVQTWVDNFVGVAAVAKRKRAAASQVDGAAEGARRSKRLARESFLPPDSQ